MSRRFGRNQKRRMREELAKANLLADMRQRMLDDQREANQAARDELRRVYEIAAPNSILLESVQVIRVGGAPRPEVQAMLYNDYSIDMHGLTELSKMDDDFLKQSIRSIPVEVLLTWVREDVMQNAVHFSVQFDGNEFRYSMSRASIDAMPKSELLYTLQYNIANQLARALVERLK